MPAASEKSVFAKGKRSKAFELFYYNQTKKIHMMNLKMTSKINHQGIINRLSLIINKNHEEKNIRLN